jgi:hypothetical protein
MTDYRKSDIFDILNSKFSELYHPTEHKAVDEVILKFKGEVIFLAVHYRERERDLV